MGMLIVPPQMNRLSRIGLLVLPLLYYRSHNRTIQAVTLPTRNDWPLNPASTATHPLPLPRPMLPQCPIHSRPVSDNDTHYKFRECPVFDGIAETKVMTLPIAVVDFHQPPVAVDELHSV